MRYLHPGPAAATQAQPIDAVFRRRRFSWTVLAAPQRFHAASGTLLRWLWAAAIGCAALGLYLGCFVAPTDARLGEAQRLLYLHLPAAWLAPLLYLAMAGWATVGWRSGERTASLLAHALAPTGAAVAAIALASGALWGRLTSGSWWLWDARLASTLILLFLYAGYLALLGAIDSPRRADRATALLAMVGGVHVPVILGSVQGWSALHHGASPGLDAAPPMAASTIAALALTTLAVSSCALATVLLRARVLIVEREADGGTPP